VGIPPGYPYCDIVVSGNWIDEQTLLPAGSFQFHEKDLKLVSEDETGKVLEIPTTRLTGLIDPKSVTMGLSLTGPEPPRFQQTSETRRARQGSM
jgi:hypothetical protein